MSKELDNAGRAADLRKDRKGTDEPWKRPGQTSQDPSLKPPKKRDLNSEEAEKSNSTA